MNALVLFGFVAFLLYLHLGVYVLYRGPGLRPNRAFFVTTLSFAAWALAYGMMRVSSGAPAYWSWYRVGQVAWSVCPALVLHFFLVLTYRGSSAGRRRLQHLVYLPAVFFVYRAIAGIPFAEDAARAPFPPPQGIPADPLWPFSLNPYLAFTVYFAGYCTAGILLCHRWGRTSSNPRERKEANTISLAGAIVLVLVTLSEVVLPELGYAVLPVVSPLLILGFVASVFYAVVRYGLMTLTPAVAADDILKTMGDALVLFDREGRILNVNEAAAKSLGWSTEDLRGRSWGALLAEERAVDETRLERFLERGPVRHFETVCRTREGGTVPVILSASTVRNPQGGPIGTVAVLRDASEKRKAEERLHHLAHHDPLTDLPNRLLFGDRLEHALRHARRQKQSVAVMVLDLDRFKEVNDGLGHEVGDRLLKAVAVRLATCVRSSDTIGRMGGDEFALVLPEVKQAADVTAVAERILDAFTKPYDTGGRVVHITTSIGTSLHPEHGADARTLLRHADLAMYRAKGAGRNRHQFFEPGMSADAVDRRALEDRIREAVERQEFALLYQAQVDLRSGRPVGLEALLRWRDGGAWVEPPAGFDAVLEEAGLGTTLGDWMLRAACAQAGEWRAAGLVPVPVAVRIGDGMLAADDLVDRVRRVLEQTGLPAAGLELQIGEEAAARDAGGALRALRRLHDLGVRIAVDGFGTGRCPLSLLMGLRIDTARVGASFVRDLEGRPDRDALLGTIVGLGKLLDVGRIVAAGVDREEQRELLRAAGCHAIQGRLAGDPLTAAETADLLRT